MITALASVIIALGLTMSNIIQTLALTGYRKLICCVKVGEVEMTEPVCEEEEEQEEEAEEAQPIPIPRPTLSIRKGYDSSPFF